MTGKRKRIKQYRAWCDQTRAAAHDNARMLAVAIASGCRLPTVPTYDLGIVLGTEETVWQRATATYWWRGEQRWTEQRISHAGYRSTLAEVRRESMNCSGTLDWLITNRRLGAREPSGEVISIDWSAVQGVSVDLATDVVSLDGADGYHGELRGPAIAPIAVAAIARCYGHHALLDHPALTPLRMTSSPQLREHRRATYGYAASISAAGLSNSRADSSSPSSRSSSTRT